MQGNFKIGIFDSGYGGLTVFRSIGRKLPQYDYIYLGDNARSPYGDHTYETVYAYTLQSVKWLFEQGCKLVILACNTASAKALRTIQQRDLPETYPDRRVLGVIRPTAEQIGNYTRSRKVGVMGTRGTVKSGSYPIEIRHYFPDVEVFQQSCPLWVPLIENNEHLDEGADYFVHKYFNALMAKDDQIDAILLGCTHYPLMLPKLKAVIPGNIKLVTQGEIVTESLADYLTRHPEIDSVLGKHGNREFYTTGDTENFNSHGSVFFGEEIRAQSISLS